LFYVHKNAAKRPYQLYRHVLGTQKSDLLYEEKDTGFNVYGWRTRNKKFLIMLSGSETSTEARFLAANDPTGEWKILAVRKPGSEMQVDLHDDQFFIWTNDKGPNWRLIQVPVNAVGEENWTEVIPVREDVVLENVECFDRYYVVTERKNGLPTIRIVNFKTGESNEIPFPEPVYNAYLDKNDEWNTSVI